jgi:hypothetical protein
VQFKREKMKILGDIGTQVTRKAKTLEEFIAITPVS